MNINDIKQLNPYSLNQEEKRKFFEKEIRDLTLHHYKNSKEYKKIFDSFGHKIQNIKLNQIPFLSTNLFKDFDLLSTQKEKISKILMSSGTSRSTPSKIHLDKENAHNQVIVLTKIMSTILGSRRLPMLIIDQNPKALDRSIFNARAAAIYGFSILGTDHTYLLDRNYNIDYDLLNKFLEKF